MGHYEQQDGQVAHQRILPRSRYRERMLANLEFAMDRRAGAHRRPRRGVGFNSQLMIVLSCRNAPASSFSLLHAPCLQLVFVLLFPFLNFHFCIQMQPRIGLIDPLNHGDGLRGLALVGELLCCC